MGKDSMGLAAGTRVFLYCRVSSEEQAASGLGLEAQEAKGRQYAALYGLELVGVVIDAGVSAKSLERPGLQSVLRWMSAGEADGILVAKLDRLTRSVKDLGTLIDRYFGERCGYRLMAVEDQIDTKSAGGRLVLNVLASVSQWEREVIGERTKSALAVKRNRGERVGAVPYGFHMAQDGQHVKKCASSSCLGCLNLERDEAEQVWLSEGARLRGDGLSLRRISSSLAGRGIVGRNGRPFSAAQVQSLLRGVRSSPHGLKAGSLQMDGEALPVRLIGQHQEYGLLGLGRLEEGFAHGDHWRPPRGSGPRAAPETVAGFGMLSPVLYRWRMATATCRSCSFQKPRCAWTIAGLSLGFWTPGRPRSTRAR